MGDRPSSAQTSRDGGRHGSRSFHIISAAALGCIMRAVAAAGAHPKLLLAKAGLNPGLADHPETWISLQDFLKLWDVAADVLKDETLGLHAGAMFDPRIMGLVGYIFVNAPDVGTAFTDLKRYLRVFREGIDLNVSVVDGTARISVATDSPDVPGRELDADHIVAAIVTMLRTAIGNYWHPSAVELRRDEPSQGIELYENFFQAPIRFSHPLDAVVFPAAFLSHPTPDPDPQLYRILKNVAEDALAQLPRADDLTARARKVILPALESGDYSISAVARELGLSVRSLQRGLAKRGTSFREVVDQTRCDKALTLLQHSDIKLTDIAFLTGYSDSSALSHAVRRWTGRPPMAYRTKQPGSRPGH